MGRQDLLIGARGAAAVAFACVLLWIPTLAATRPLAAAQESTHRKGDAGLVVTVVDENGVAVPAALVLLEGVGTHTRRSEEHTSELQSRLHLVCRLLLE